MDAKKTDSLFKGLPSWAKGVIVILLILILLVIAYLIYSRIKKAKGAKGFIKTADDASNEVARLKGSGEKLYAKEIDYQQTVNSIVINLNGCETLSTELKVIDDITKVVKRPIDWYYLVSKFGTKDIENCLEPGSTTYALPELLKDQLDSSGLYFGVGGGIGSGWTTNSFNLLEGYLNKIGVII